MERGRERDNPLNPSGILMLLFRPRGDFRDRRWAWKGITTKPLSLIPKNLLQITLRANISLNRPPLPFSASLRVHDFLRKQGKKKVGWEEDQQAIWFPPWWIEHGTYANSPRFLAGAARILTQSRPGLECAVVAVKQSAQRCCRRRRRRHHCSCCCLGLNCFYLLSELDGKQTLWPQWRAADTAIGQSRSSSKCKYCMYKQDVCLTRPQVHWKKCIFFF